MKKILSRSTIYNRCTSRGIYSQWGPNIAVYLTFVRKIEDIKMLINNIPNLPIDRIQGVNRHKQTLGIMFVKLSKCQHLISRLCNIYTQKHMIFLEEKIKKVLNVGNYQVTAGNVSLINLKRDINVRLITMINIEARELKRDGAWYRPNSGHRDLEASPNVEYKQFVDYVKQKKNTVPM